MMDEDGEGKNVEGGGEQKVVEEEEEIHQLIYPEKEGRKKKRHIVCVSHSVSFFTCLQFPVYYIKLIENTIQVSYVFTFLFT